MPSSRSDPDLANLFFPDSAGASYFCSSSSGNRSWRGFPGTIGIGVFHRQL